MGTVRMPVGAVGMVVQTGQYHRSTGGARCAGAKGIAEAYAVSGQSIEVGRAYDGVAVTAQCFAAMIVRDNKHDIGTLHMATSLSSCHLFLLFPVGVRFSSGIFLRC